MDWSFLQHYQGKVFWIYSMGIITKLVKTISFGCRSRTHSVDEYDNCYDNSRRSVIPIAQRVESNIIVAVNEVGEEIIILVENKPKWDPNM